jgi:transcriptional regulator with XRE-family HTH domain
MRTSRTRTEFASKSFGPALSVRTIAELEHKGIAGRIKQARNEKGLTQEQMANLLDVKQRTYQNYESATKPRIPWERMNDIGRITRKKVEWLLHGEAPDLISAMNGSIPKAIQDQLVELDRKLDEVLKRLPRPEQPTGEPDIPRYELRGKDRRRDAQDRGEPETGEAS